MALKYHGCAAQVSSRHDSIKPANAANQREVDLACVSQAPLTCAGGRDDVSSKQTPSKCKICAYINDVMYIYIYIYILYVHIHIEGETEMKRETER